MTRDEDLTVAVHATSRRGVITRRRRITVDVLRADGEVQHDVRLDEVLRGRHLPADAWATRHAAERSCPRGGPGPWIEYATGRPFDLPS